LSEEQSVVVLCLAKKHSVNALLPLVLTIIQNVVLPSEPLSLRDHVEPELPGLTERLSATFWENKHVPTGNVSMSLNRNHTHVNVTLDTNSVKMERNVSMSTNVWLLAADTAKSVARKELV